MEDAFLDSYWESVNDVQEPNDHYWEAWGEAYLSQWE